MPKILQDYFEYTVKPTVNEYLSENGRCNIRRARLAAIVVEHLVDYYSLAYKKTKEGVRNELTILTPSYSIVRSAADATKHRSVQRKNADIKDNTQITSPPGLFNAPFGEAYFREAIEIYLVKDNNEKISLEAAIKEIMKVWEEKISSINMENKEHEKFMENRQNH